MLTLTELALAHRSLGLIGHEFTQSDLPTCRAIAETLAEHIEVAPGSIQWWAAAVTLPYIDQDGALQDGAIGSGTIAIISRESTVPYAKLYHGVLRGDEADKACAFITMRKNATWGAVLAFGRDEAQERLAMLELNPALTVPIAEARSIVAMYDRALSRIVPGIGAGGTSVELAPDEPFTRNVDPVDAPVPAWASPPLRCPRCESVWQPRSPRPRQCPRCRSLIRWPREAAS